MSRTERVPLGLDVEENLWREGYDIVAGLDEVGRGSWAGPVVAAAVVLPPDGTESDVTLCEVHDSKQLTPAQRERLYPLIQEVSLAVGVGLASPEEVDALNVLEATRLAMSRAVQQMDSQPDYLLLDHLTLPELSLPQRPIPHGDSLVLSIAAASIVAKVFRDRLMVNLSLAHPGYDFEHNKGYGTLKHREALSQLGPCAAHRRTYRPIAKLVERR